MEREREEARRASSDNWVVIVVVSLVTITALLGNIKSPVFTVTLQCFLLTVNVSALSCFPAMPGFVVLSLTAPHCPALHGWVILVLPSCCVDNGCTGLYCTALDSTGLHWTSLHCPAVPSTGESREIRLRSER